jgi:hypothetical protein
MEDDKKRKLKLKIAFMHISRLTVDFAFRQWLQSISRSYKVQLESAIMSEDKLITNVSHEVSFKSRKHKDYSGQEMMSLKKIESQSEYLMKKH